jgi:hypothetical protein
VKREIIAADFRDRVVHHFLYNRIYPIFDKKFIYDSYSCRVGKGTLFGIKRAQHFVKSCGACRGDVWVLRLDIKGFFMAINREILFNLITCGLQNEACELSEFLIRKIVFNNPLKNALFKSPKSAWNDLPKDKSLINSAPNCGLPIGNLTSQVFLLNELRLILHPKKIKLQKAEKGFAFLGAYIYQNKTLAGERIIDNFKKCVCAQNHDLEKQSCIVQSYLGLASHFGL